MNGEPLCAPCPLALTSDRRMDGQDNVDVFWTQREQWTSVGEVVKDEGYRLAGIDG